MLTSIITPSLVNNHHVLFVSGMMLFCIAQQLCFWSVKYNQWDTPLQLVLYVCLNHSCKYNLCFSHLNDWLISLKPLILFHFNFSFPGKSKTACAVLPLFPTQIPSFHLNLSEHTSEKIKIPETNSTQILDLWYCYCGKL